MDKSKNTLVSRGTRVWRCTGSAPGLVTIFRAGRYVDLDADWVKQLPDVKPYQCAFDEWQILSGSQKEAFIRLAVNDNHGIVWRDEWIDKIIKNMPIFDHCVAETCNVVRRGFEHYCVRTIIEVARHHTFLAQKDAEYKIDNNMQPNISRLLMVMFPEIPAGFYETRDRKKDIAA